MKAALRILHFIVVVAALSTCHIALNSLLSHPWSMINVLFVVFALHVLLFEKGYVVWLAFATHFLIELYGTLPFGVTLFSATMATLIGFWLFESVFTNRSWYTATVLSLSLLGIYRLLYSVLLWGVQQVTPLAISWKPLLFNFAWELALSTALVTLVYGSIYRYMNASRTQKSIFMRL